MEISKAEARAIIGLINYFSRDGAAWRTCEGGQWVDLNELRGRLRGYVNADGEE